MRRSIGLVLVCTAFLFLASAELPAQPTLSGALSLEPAPIEPKITLTPEQQKQLQFVIDRWMIQRQQMAGRTPLENGHALLDQALTGDQLSPAIKPSFVELFAPSQNALHQFLNDQNTRLQQQFKKSEQSEGSRSWIEQPVIMVQSVKHRPGSNQEIYPIMYRYFHAGNSAESGFLRLTQTESGTVDGMNLTATESEEGVTEAEASGDLGKGTKVKVTGEDWHDTDNWIAEGGGLGLELNGERKGVSGNVNFSGMDGAKVKRCPSAAGLVPGKARKRDGFMLTATDSKGTTYQVGATGFTQTIAEGHVGDDAIVKDVKATVTTTLTGRWNSDVYVVRVDGTATFDPHSEDRPSITRTGCSSNAGTPPIQDCDQVTNSISLFELKRTYIKAEKKWNFEEQDEAGMGLGNPSACVKVKFNPKSKTVRGRPKQSIPVKAEIITIQGEQPTWGRFDKFDLWDSPGGDIQKDGTATAPGAPAQLTYTAPPQPWPPNKPPGFYVRKMTSRAGAFKWGVYVRGLDTDSFVWLLKPGLKLSIHHKWEVNGMMGHLLSETTFPIDLMPNERGDLFGQTSLQRTYQTVGGFGGIACVDKGQWAEQWQAYAIFDEKGESLTIKLRFDAGPKQAIGVCGPVTKPHTIPGIRSDSVRTPLDQFKMPAQDGAKQQFVFDFGGFAKNVVDVKLEEVGVDK